MKIIKEFKVRFVEAEPSLERSTYAIIVEQPYYIQGKLLGGSFQRINVHSEIKLSEGDSILIEIRAVGAIATVLEKTGGAK